MMNRLPTCGLLVATCLASLATAQDNWNQFRGPTADGKTTATGLPVEWSESKNVVWKTPIDGKAWSSPVTWGNQIWMTNATADGKRMSAVCVDFETGEVLRDIEVFHNEKPYFCHEFNSYASCTPFIEEGRIYVHFGRYGTACLDTQTGEKLWERRDLDCNHFRGPGSSPIVHGDKLYVPFDGHDVQYVVALDKNTGKTAWLTQRNIDYKTDNGDRKKAYGTAAIIEVDGQTQVVIPSAGATQAFHPESGKVLWQIDHGGMNANALPLYEDGLLVINTAAGGFKLFAMKPGVGQLDDSAVAWKCQKGVPTRTGQIWHDGKIFMVSDGGVASCIDAHTGETIWQERMGGEHSTSPILSEGKLYFFDQEGTGYVVAASDEFKLLAENKLDDGCMASPAVKDQSLIVRTKSALYRLSK